MFNLIRSLYTTQTQQELEIFANHILVLTAFFLPLNKGTVGSGIFILLGLLLLRKNLVSEIFATLKNRVIVSFFALWILHYIGIIYSDDSSRSKLYADDMYFLLYPIVILIFARYEFIFRILSSFILGVFLSELLSYGFIFELLISPMPSILNMNPIASKYEPSPFTFHVEYGYILAIASAFLLQKLLKQTTKIEKIVLSLFFATITLNIFFNSARTGYILFFISNGSILLFYYKHYILSKLHLIIPSLLIVLLSVWTLSENVRREYQETIQSINAMYYHNDFSSALGARIQYVTLGFDVLKETNPLIGLGTDMHGISIVNKASERNEMSIVDYLLSTGQYTGQIKFIDCEYNSIILQFGMIGLLIYLNLFYQLLRFHNQNRSLQIMKNSLVVTSLFYAFTSSVFAGYLVPIIFIILSSLMVIQIKNTAIILPKLTIKGFLLYALSLVLLFIISKIT